MGRHRHKGQPPDGDRPPFDMGPPGWGPPVPGDWGPPPPGDWDPRGPPPPDWGPRGPPGWGPHPGDWPPHPEDWRPRFPEDCIPRYPEDWRPPHPEDLRGLHPEELRGLHPEELRRLHMEDWRLPHPEDWGPPLDPWGPEPMHPGPVPHGPPPGLPPPPPIGIPPPDPAAYGPVPGIPPIPPPACVPPIGFPAYPPPGWPAEVPVEEALPNPPPDQPQWIKALISAPASDSAPVETKKPPESPAAPAAPAAPPAPPPEQKASKALGLLGKRTFEKPPPGRSTGIISFIGLNSGCIEREDLEKFTFSFAAFFGNPRAMTPGVRVHFTACKEKNNLIATDVKVAPGGTENVDEEIFEAVVSQPIVEPQPGERQYSGQVHVNIGPLRTNLKYERKDSTVTLLKDDQVLINLLTDIVTDKRRATNIRPKIPSTFTNTKEKREEGVIVSLKDAEGVIRSEEHGELPFHLRENFSDVDFTADDVNEEVEFTVTTLRAGKRAIRVRRLKEPLLLALCPTSSSSSSSTVAAAIASCKALRAKTQKMELGPNMRLDTELYEGIVSQPIIEPTVHSQGYPGQIYANIGPLRTNVTFDHRDCNVTLLKNDHVLINLLVDIVTRKRRAHNIKAKVPFTFSYTKEKRETGVITFLGPDQGIVTSAELGELHFDIGENFSDDRFDSSDLHREVEFTVSEVDSEKRAIRLLRKEITADKMLQEQKRRDEEEKRRKKEEEEEKSKLWEEELKRRAEKEAERERKKKEEVAAALEAAKCKWTPLGFKVRNPDTMDDLSKERFEGTVLRAITKFPRKEIKKEAQEEVQEEEQEEVQEEQKVKEEKVEVKEEKPEAEEVKEENGAEQEAQQEQEEEEARKGDCAPAVVKVEPDVGRLVMTVDGKQKQLMFSRDDLFSSATMMDGDKVRFNIATNLETKEERATFVEILPDSFEESIEQRRQGIVIEFHDAFGLIKCSQNPQLYFHMSEVIEKKKLQLNEKVEFSVVPHETAEGGNQAIRIRRFTEKVFLPGRKLGGVGANKGKMTIKLTKAAEDAEKPKAEVDKLKAVVKNLRSQDKSSVSRDHGALRRKHGHSRTRSRSPSKSKARSRSRSPPRDQFGRIIKKRRSPSADRDRKSSRHKRSRSRERSHRRTRSRSRTKSSSRSPSRDRDRTRDRDRSRNRSRERSRDRNRDSNSRNRPHSSRESEDSRRRRREPSPRRPGVMDDELARKKRELEELNEMIAYKKSLVDMDPGQRTCIDYDHGRISVPLTEYKPVRSILKKRPDGPEYHHHPPLHYDDPYYNRQYDQYPDRRYGDPYSDPYAGRAYPDPPYESRSYVEDPYEKRLFGEAPYAAASSANQRYSDRYDVYDEPYEERYDPAYMNLQHQDLYRHVRHSRSPEAHGPSPSSQSGQGPAASGRPTLSHTVSSSHPSFRPPSPSDPPPRSPSPKMKNPSPPPPEKPPLDRFLDMLNNKAKAEKKAAAAAAAVYMNDDLLPHERALQDGSGFSQIVGLIQEPPTSSLTAERQRKVSPNRSSVERTSEEPKAKEEPYDKIHSLLRTIGLKLSTGDVSRLTSRAQEKIHSPRSTSLERDTLSSPREDLRMSRTSSIESGHVHSPSPVRSSSLEPLNRHRAVSEYEGFLDQQELEALQMAQELQSLTKTMGISASTVSPVRPPPGPPPTHYQHPPVPVNWPLGVTTQVHPQSPAAATGGTPASFVAGQQPHRSGPTAGSPPGPPPGPPPQRPGQPPPGPPPGPPPRRPPGQPPFTPPSSHTVFPFIGQSTAVQPPTTTTTTTAEPAPEPAPASSSPVSSDQSTISTTVARCLKVIETVKSLSAQPPAKPVKSVQFSLPRESPSGSSSHISAETDDDVKSKQKEKLDLYNQRLMEKREQRYRDMQARRRDKNRDSTPVAADKPLSSDPKNVWICGHSLVYWAESRAKSPEVGMQLGMDPSKVAVWWKGIQGMTWSQLLPQLHQLKVTWPNPDVLIIHLGGNDLSTDSPTDLLASVKKDLTSMRSIFPQCILVWSNILPRRVWRHSADSHEVDLIRTTVNRRIQNIMSELGGVSLSHDNIRCGANTGLYRADGVHLSPKGIDVFNLNLQDLLEKWEMEATAAE